MKIKRPPLRYHGGKFRMAKHIIPLFPDHQTYVEPFGGGGSILLLKPRSKNEIYNDLDDEIVNVFQILRDEEAAARLIKLLRMTPFSRAEMLLAWEECEDPVEKARRTITRSQMGFGSAGATKARTGFRGLDNAESSFSSPAKQWDELPNHLDAITKRLKGTVLENTDASHLIDRTDGPNTLFYLDPPYMMDTRSSMKGGLKYYRHEMTDRDHEQLLEKVLTLKGKVVISGYASVLYQDMLKEFTKHTFESRASSKKGTVMREECVWISPNALDNGLFAIGA